MPHDDVILSPRTSAWTVRPCVDDTLRDLSPADPTAAVLVAPVGDGPDGDAAARAALDALGADADTLLATHEPAGTAGSVTTVPLPPGAHAVRRVLLVGTGDGSDRGWRTAGAAVGRATRGRGRRRARRRRARPRSARSPAYVESVVLASWASPRWTKEGAVAGCEPAARPSSPARTDAAAVDRAVVRARAQLVARGLAATPSNTKNPAWLARQARTVARRTGLEAPVWDERRLRRAASAASSRWARARPRRRGWSASTTCRAAPRPRRRGSSSSARASRSTPAACR